MCARTWHNSSVCSPWLGSHSCRQTFRQPDGHGDWLQSGSRGWVIMLSSLQGGRQTSGVMAAVCSSVVWVAHYAWEGEKKVNTATGFGGCAYVWLATFYILNIPPQHSNLVFALQFMMSWPVHLSYQRTCEALFHIWIIHMAAYLKCKIPLIQRTSSQAHVGFFFFLKFHLVMCDKGMYPVSPMKSFISRARLLTPGQVRAKREHNHIHGFFF